MTSKVNALSIPEWNTNIDYTITRGEFYNWTSSSAYSNVESQYIDLGNYSTFNVFTNKNDLITATNGISFTYFLNQYLDPDYLYNVTTYVCADFNINNGATGMTYPYARSSGGYPGVITENMQYSYTTSSALSPTAFIGEAFTGCRQYTSLIQPSVRSSWFALRFTSASSSLTGHYYVLGFNLESLGVARNVIRDEIQNIVDNSGLASASSVQEVQESVEQVQAEMEEVNSSIEDQTQQQEQNHNETMDKFDEQIEQNNQNHDEFMNSDISEEDKELPDDSKYQDYTDTENDLKDKVNEADMSVISIGIDANSSAWVWDTLTRLIQSNSIVFGMFIAILSIGIIKLALGR